MTLPISRIRSAAIDGRVHNPFFRKTQLKRLHDALVDDADAIQAVISQDTKHRQAEVKVEFALALKYLNDAFATIEPEQVLKQEYSIANGKDDANAATPIGIVVIEPTTHAFLSSLVSALAPAILAGNCVIVQAEQNLLQSPRLILELIDRVLDNDIFGYSFETITSENIGHSHIRVPQNGASTTDQVSSSSSSRVVAIVERDADVVAAARDIIEARFCLCGKSPYAPDVVLVNEWIRKDLTNALLQESARFAPDGNAQGKKTMSFLKDDSVNVLSSGSSGTIVVVDDIQSSLLQHRVQQPCLVLHTVTSIDHAIDISRRFNHLAAAYVFTASLPTAKYICQFVDCGISFVNHIPRSILYASVAPISHPWNPSTRNCYTESMFTRPSPTYLHSPAKTPFEHVAITATGQQLNSLDAEIHRKLPEFKRPDKAAGMGFFEQGVVSGASIFLSTVVASTGVLVFYSYMHFVHSH